MYKQANNTAQAATHYDNSTKNTTDDQRELESRALLKSARRMQDLQERIDTATHDEIDEILTTNRKLWTLFYDAALENDGGNRPNDLRSNIINLANFIFKRSLDAMANPTKEKFDILISINRDIAAGLTQSIASSPQILGEKNINGEASAPSGTGGVEISA